MRDMANRRRASTSSMSAPQPTAQFVLDQRRRRPRFLNRLGEVLHCHRQTFDHLPLCRYLGSRPAPAPAPIPTAPWRRSPEQLTPDSITSFRSP